ncbi:MAG: hypothetical protein R2861_14015 [Desulfobacterales bacterium]
MAQPAGPADKLLLSAAITALVFLRVGIIGVIYHQLKKHIIDGLTASQKSPNSSLRCILRFSWYAKFVIRGFARLADFYGIGEIFLCRLNSTFYGYIKAEPICGSGLVSWQFLRKFFEKIIKPITTNENVWILKIEMF